MKTFYVNIIGAQQEAAMDLPGYTYMTDKGQGYVPGLGRVEQKYRVVCEGTTATELREAVKGLPGYMQGFNVIERHEVGLGLKRQPAPPAPATRLINAGDLARAAEGAGPGYGVTLTDGTELCAIRRAARGRGVDCMAVRPATFAAPGQPQTVWRYRRLRAGEIIRILD